MRVVAHRGIIDEGIVLGVMLSLGIAPSVMREGTHQHLRDDLVFVDVVTIDRASAMDG